MRNRPWFILPLIALMLAASLWLPAAVAPAKRARHRLLQQPPALAGLSLDELALRLLAEAPQGAADLLYASYLGGSSWEEGLRIALDAQGHVYVAGWTQSADLPVTLGAFDTTYGGARDVFIAKFGASRLIYLTFLGGSDEEWAYGLAVGPDGSAYLAGATKSRDFPTTPGSLSPTYRGGPADGFLTKISPDGRSLLYSTFIGGSGEDVVQAVAVDASGCAYLTGWTESADFPKTAGAFDTTLNSEWDAFALKLNAVGNQLLYGTYLGGSLDERGLDIAVDTLGCAYLAGYTFSEDFPITAGAYDSRYRAGLGDAFVTKLSASGAALVFSTFLGGDGEDKARGIAIDAEGCVYIAGMTRSSDFSTTPGAFDQTLNGFQDIFAIKLNPAGSAAIYATLLGGVAEDQGYGIAVDALGCAYVVGSTKSGDYPTTAGAYDTVFNGKFTYQSDPVLSKLNPQGSALLYSTFLGGTLVDMGYAVAVDGQQVAYITGYTASSNFPTTEDAFDHTLGGQGDAFLIKLSTLPETPTPTATRSATASRTPTRSPTATRTGTPTGTPAISPTLTPTATASPTPTVTAPVWLLYLPLILRV